jgi:hypothetical protein
MSTEALSANKPAVTGQRGADVDPAEVGQVMGQLMADLAATSAPGAGSAGTSTARPTPGAWT